MTIEEILVGKHLVFPHGDKLVEKISETFDGWQFRVKQFPFLLSVSAKELEDIIHKTIDKEGLDFFSKEQTEGLTRMIEEKKKTPETTKEEITLIEEKPRQITEEKISEDNPEFDELSKLVKEYNQISEELQITEEDEIDMEKEKVLEVIIPKPLPLLILKEYRQSFGVLSEDNSKDEIIESQNLHAAIRRYLEWNGIYGHTTSIYEIAKHFKDTE